MDCREDNYMEGYEGRRRGTMGRNYGEDRVSPFASAIARCRKDPETGLFRPGPIDRECVREELRGEGIYVDGVLDNLGQNRREGYMGENEEEMGERMGEEGSSRRTSGYSRGGYGSRSTSGHRSGEYGYGSGYGSSYGSRSTSGHRNGEYGYGSSYGSRSPSGHRSGEYGSGYSSGYSSGYGSYGSGRKMSARESSGYGYDSDDYYYGRSRSGSRGGSRYY